MSGGGVEQIENALGRAPRARPHSPGTSIESLEPRMLLSIGGQISGLVYNDINANGRADSGDKLESSWVVYLDKNRNGIMDAGEPSRTTNGDGTLALNGR